jgi:primosomal protein N' (replication factor Y) (superfamily II helicase)
VCRVRVDVAAVHRRVFDYLVPDPMAPFVRVGTIVRVPLHGRRVRGWVIAADVEPETTRERLRPLAKVASDGPPPDVVALCDWGAWRWAGPAVSLLRAASAPNGVRPGSWPAAAEPAHDPRIAPPASTVREWPPAADRRALVDELLADDGSSIVIVPDAPRAPLLVRALEASGRRVLVLRGDQSDATRTAAWAAAREGGCCVVGGRIAVFAPVPDLARIIVLDEGDEALKEERAPAWNARELAVERARAAGASVTLVSPAPTVDAEALAGTPIRPARTIERDGWPAVEVVDPRDEPPGTGLLTTRLATALHAALDTGGRAVCMLNRRGRARLLACRACNELARCEQCGAAVRADADGLACPRCGTTRPPICLNCHATRLSALRVGVTGARDALASLLPRYTVVEIDAATGHVDSGDVFIGTEAVFHRLPVDRARPVRLVSFLEFDQELLAPRYRAAEQALWLLVRAARLVGGRRSANGGRVLIQSRLADHEVIAAARHADPFLVTDVERERRAALGFPPFGGLAVLSGAETAVSAATEALRASESLTVLGPAHGHTLLRAPTTTQLCDVLAGADLEPARAKGRLRVEVDPLRV